SITLQGFVLGTFDFLPKAQDSVEPMPEIAEELIAKIKAAAESNGVRVDTPPKELRRTDKSPLASQTPPTRVVAIGISTAGPNALQYMLAQLPADFPGTLVIVQHMPDGFTEMFARRLDETCAL